MSHYKVRPYILKDWRGFLTTSYGVANGHVYKRTNIFGGSSDESFDLQRLDQPASRGFLVGDVSFPLLRSSTNVRWDNVWNPSMHAANVNRIKNGEDVKLGLSANLVTIFGAAALVVGLWVSASDLPSDPKSTVSHKPKPAPAEKALNSSSIPTTQSTSPKTYPDTNDFHLDEIKILQDAAGNELVLMPKRALIGLYYSLENSFLTSLTPRHIKDHEWGKAQARQILDMPVNSNLKINSDDFFGVGPNEPNPLDSKEDRVANAFVLIPKVIFRNSLQHVFSPVFGPMSTAETYEHRLKSKSSPRIYIMYSIKGVGDVSMTYDLRGKNEDLDIEKTILVNRTDKLELNQ